ncbi:deoxyribonuclease V [Mucilaginibacter phyllosphaerae]|uniref:Endonuclease V n=1 Tax=Mucilaginibacter phyllosphaerae TaxID=1812349 RepID=A0A4Y8ABI3_9SPHI|nr:deoxyribonuclease V [Mucilaginibacter phyllosphaerae]MBB3969270.1 deoxyribonuclease V [Mucilaginibacter phyllosphaerae]TEW65931.1 deoxyribonuclease V [Mucilaginibacter phyllosphaerae]GGH07339.1 endonuclease V [Mucilaginibacter phyllosphaerae]
MDPHGYEHLTPAEAIAYQNQLRQKINICELTTPIKTIAGADISFDKNSDILYAGIVVFRYPDMQVITTATAISHTSFPYISGLLAFREVPALFNAWNNLYSKPDILVLDGQGIAHERRMGIATHFGLLTGVPTIGSAKSRLYGKYIEPADKLFAESPMYDNNELVGIALRSKPRCKPIYISPGHNINMQQSVDVIKNCIRGYRIPEPTRQAHLLVNKIRIENGDNRTKQMGLFD